MNKPRKSTTRPKRGTKAMPVRLLSGGNPQIAKADGGAPVQAYIAAMQGWKKDVGRRLDALIVWTVTDLRKAVKVAVFRGASLGPRPPPVASKDQNTRYVHIHEGDDLDEARPTDWVTQAAALPDWVT